MKIDNMEEIWKDIPSLEGYYQCSNLGRIKSLSRLSKIGSNCRLVDERILKPINVQSGYCCVNLTYPKRKQYLIHTLVAKTFLDYKDGLVVNHKDFNKKNNRLDNIEVITQKENILHSIIGGKNGQLLLNLETGIFYERYSDVANMLGISSSAFTKRLNKNKGVYLGMQKI